MTSNARELNTLRDKYTTPGLTKDWRNRLLDAAQEAVNARGNELAQYGSAQEYADAMQAEYERLANTVGPIQPTASGVSGKEQLAAARDKWYDALNGTAAGGYTPTERDNAPTADNIMQMMAADAHGGAENAVSLSRSDLSAYQKWMQENFGKTPKYLTFDRDEDNLYGYADSDSVAKYNGTDNPQLMLNSMMTEGEYNTSRYLLDNYGLGEYLSYLTSKKDELESRYNNWYLGMVGEVSKRPFVSTIASEVENIKNQMSGIRTLATQVLPAAWNYAKDAATGNVQWDYSGLVDAVRQLNPENSTLENMAIVAGLGKDAAAQVANGYANRLDLTGNDGAYIHGQARDLLRQAEGERLGDVANQTIGQWINDTFGADVDLNPTMQWIYQSLASGVMDSTVNGALFGGVGSATMGIGAMTDTMREVKEQGGTNLQALMMGTISGGLEIFTEGKTFEHVTDLIGKPANVVKDEIMRDFAKSLISEGVEEMASEIGGMVSDYFIMADKGDFRRSVQEYMKQGYDESGAMAATIKDGIGQVLLAGAGGAFGALFTSGGAVALNRITAHVAKNDVAKMSKSYTAEAAELFKNGFGNSNMTPAQYQAAFNAIYRAGVEEISQARMTEAAPYVLDVFSDEQIDQIYMQGVKDGLRGEAESASEGTSTSVTADEGTTSSVTAEAVPPSPEGKAFGDAATPSPEGKATGSAEADAQKTVTTMTEAERREYISSLRQNGLQVGLVRDYATARQEAGQEPIKLTDEQRASLRVVDQVARYYGYEMHVVETLDGANGMTVAGSRKIEFGLDAVGQAYVQVATHEMVHNVAVLDPDGYQVMANYVIDYLTEHGYDLEGNIQRRAGNYDKQGGVTLDRDAAIEEIVAESYGTVFSDENAVFEFVKEDRKLGERILGVLQKIINKIRATIERYAGTQNRDEINLLLGDTDTLVDMARLFRMALERANENGARADETALGATVTRYSEDSGNDEINRIKDQIRSVQGQLSHMEPVAAIEVEVPAGMTRQERRKWVEKRIDEIGETAYRDEIGEVEIGEDNAKTAVRYMKRQGEIGALLAVKDVIEHGILANEHVHHKGRPYNTYTYAAPVVINGERGNVGVVVRGTVGMNYHVHRILAPNGTVFEYKETAEPLMSDGSNAEERSGKQPIGSADGSSVTQPEKIVNNEFQSDSMAAGESTSSVTADAATPSPEGKALEAAETTTEERTESEGETTSSVSADVATPSPEGKALEAAETTNEAETTTEAENAALAEEASAESEDSSEAEGTSSAEDLAEDVRDVFSGRLDRANGVFRKYGNAKLTRDQRLMLRGLDDVCKRFGLRLNVVEQLPFNMEIIHEGDGEFTMSLKGVEHGAVNVFAHGLTDYLKRENPEGFQQLSNVALEELNGKQAEFEQEMDGESPFDVLKEAEKIQAAAKKNNLDMDIDQAIDQVVGDAVATALSSETAMQRLVDMNRGLVAKIRGWLNQFVDGVRDALTGYADKEDRGAVLALMFDDERLERISAALASALDSSPAGVANREAVAQETKYSLPSGRTYSYNELVAKPDMHVTQVTAVNWNTRQELAAMGKDSVRKYATETDMNGTPIMYVDDLGAKVTVGRTGLLHSADGQTIQELAPIIAKYGDILKNSIVVNEEWPTRAGITGTYLMIGAASDVNGDLYIVKSTVDQSTMQVSDVTSLHAVSAKNGSSAAQGALSLQQNAGGKHNGTTEVSITGLLNIVKDLYPAILSQNVTDHFGITRPVTKYTPYLKFSMKEDVERKNDLIAVHNLDEQGIEGLLELGGIAMPSVAVVKDSMGHDKFGEYSVVLYSSAIDPQANKQNRAYGQDAYTVTFPKVEYQLNENAVRNVSRRLNALKANVADQFGSYISSFMYELSRGEIRKNLSRLMDEAKRNYGLKAAYLESIGEHVEPVTRAADKSYDTNSTEKYDALMQAAGLTDDEVSTMSLRQISAAVSAHTGAILGDVTGFKAAQSIKAYVKDKLSGFQEKTVIDQDATQQALQSRFEGHESDFDEWLNGLLDGVYGEKGLVNGKDTYTSSGSARGFWQTHDRFTLDNALKIMRRNGGKNGDSTFVGISSIMAAAAQEFKSLDELRGAENRLEMLDNAEYSGMIDGLNDRLYELISQIRQETGTSFNIDGVGEVLMEAARGRQTTGAINKVFGKYGMNLTENTAQDALALFMEARDMPTGYFEAKPERAIMPRDIAAVLVPSNGDAALTEALRDAGYNVMTYQAGSSAARLEALNSIPDVKFNLREDREGDPDSKEMIMQATGATQSSGQRNGGTPQSATQTAPLAGGPSAADVRGIEKATKAMQVAHNRAQTIARQFIKEFKSTYGLKELTDGITRLMDEIALHGVTDLTTQEATKLMLDVINEAQFDGDITGEYKQYLSEFRKYEIGLGRDEISTAKSNYGSLTAFYKLIRGTFKINTKSKNSLDAAWSEMNGIWPGLFPEEITDPGARLAHLVYIAEKTHEKVGVYEAFGVDADTVAVDAAMRLEEDILNRLAKALQNPQYTADAILNVRDEKQQETDEALRNTRKELRWAQSDNADLQGKLDKVSERYREAQQEISDQDKEILKLKGEAKAQAAALTEAQAAQQAEAQKQAAALQKQAERLQKQAEALKEQRAALRAKFKQDMKNELARLRAEQRKNFDQIAATLRAAKEAGDSETQAKMMQQYRQQMRRIGLQEQEALARIGYRRMYETHATMSQTWGRIEKYARNLRDMLAKPDKNKHVPTELQVPLMTVLNNLDFRRNGRDTKGTTAWAESLKGVRDALARQLARQQGRAEDTDDTTGVWMSLCEEQLEKFSEAVDTITAVKKPISQLTMEEMKELSNCLATVQHAINSINQTWTNARHASIDALGAETVDELQRMKTNKAQTGLLRGLDNMLNVEQLDARAFFERLGGENGAAMSVYEELRQGQDKAYEKVREASEAIPELMGYRADMKASEVRQRVQTIRGWAEEKHTFDFAVPTRGGISARQVTMTGTQLMELYALSKREQARKHLLTGGFMVEYSKNGDNATYKLDEAMLDSMINQLTDDQKKTIDKLQEYLSATVSEWGNEVTRKMYLYEMFGEENYWPIHSERDYLRTREADGQLLFNALTNAGFAKKTQDQVRNPIIIGDALTDFADHVSRMSTFNGLAMPMDDLLRWYNWAAKDEEGHVNYTTSIKKEIGRVIGSAGKQYVQNLINDLNGMGQSAPTTSWLGKALGNYKAAAIAAKLRVAVQQPTAILRASAEINPIYLTALVRGVGSNVVEEMQAHSPLAWWKGNGNYEIGTGNSMKSILFGMQFDRMGDVNEKGGWLAGKMDDIGWAAIWQACKAETAKEHSELTTGSDEYWQQVVSRFEEICMKTQVVDTVLTRSAMMRSKDTTMKAATAFMSEPTKNYNLMRSAIGEFRRALDSGDTAARNKAAGRIMRSAGAIIAAQALNSIATAAFDMFKYWEPDKEDEEGNPITRLDEFMSNWTDDMLDGINPLANIPFIKDAYEICTGGSVERMDMSVISKLYSAVTRLQSYASGNQKGYTLWAAVRPTVTGIGDLLGLPVSGLVADTELALNIMNPGSVRTYELNKTANGAYEQMYKAIMNGDAARYEKLRADARQGVYGQEGKTDEAIDKGIADQLAMNDPRIREYWQKRETGKTDGLRRLRDQIMADGFTEAQVIRAVNRYATLAASEAKSLYMSAVESGDEQKQEQYRTMLHDVGVNDETISSWTAEQENKELAVGNWWTKDNLYTSIRSKETTDADLKDIKDEIIRTSTASDPESSLTSSLASEFKTEYITAFDEDRAEADRLKQRLMAVGVPEKTIDGWTHSNKGLYEAIRSGESGSALTEYAETVRKWSSAQDPMKTMASNLKSEFAGEYRTMVANGNAQGAAKLKAQLMACGLSGETIDGWIPAAKTQSATAGTTPQSAAQTAPLAGEPSTKTTSTKTPTLKETVTNVVETMSGDDAAEELARMIENGTSKSSIVTALNNQYKPLYIAAVQAGNDREVDRIQNLLADLGLRRKDGMNYYRGEVFRDWEREAETEE